MGGLCAEKCGVVERYHLENGAKEATLGAQIQWVFFSISAKEEFQWDSDNKLAGGHGPKNKLRILKELKRIRRLVIMPPQYIISPI